jgi:hypothetical protein
MISSKAGKDSIWSVSYGIGPIVAVALHDGHEVRHEVREHLALSEEIRLREEDPYSGAWTAAAGVRIVARRSRFEVDLNRPRHRAVYAGPEDAWGLPVWRTQLPADIRDRSLAQYDAFYTEIAGLIGSLVDSYGRIVVLDLHTYNHRRAGPNAEPADAALNPEVNLGTGSMDRVYWAPVVDRFVSDLRGVDFQGRHLDVRENVKFRGGGFSAYVHEHFPRSACVLAVEFKKFFMDEWTGHLDALQHTAIGKALQDTIPGLLEALKGVEGHVGLDVPGSPA